MAIFPVVVVIQPEQLGKVEFLSRKLDTQDLFIEFEDLFLIILTLFTMELSLFAGQVQAAWNWITSLFNLIEEEIGDSMFAICQSQGSPPKLQF